MTMRPDEISSVIKKQIQEYSAQTTAEKAGSVIQVGDGIARIYGLLDAMSGELLEFYNGVKGIALNLDEDSIGAVILGSDAGIKEGDPVKRTGRIAEVPVGDGLLGRVVDPLGNPVDNKGPIVSLKTRQIERIAPGVIKRGEVNTPLHTGIKVIDSMVPIGRGQRELIIGDRQTGKTAICIDTIINQKHNQDTSPVYCVYVAIGQKNSEVARITNTLQEAGAMEYTTIVVASASDASPLQYIAPFAGCAIAEEWMDAGKDVLIIYDDLSKHAVAYRALSLLLRRPPGREAFPGDVFYLHSRLLERAARMADEHGGGSITALPIIETQAGDISAYIPTNVISITDGQIFLETELFHNDIRPAINPGLSVSRVGGAAQIKAVRGLSGKLRTELAQYRELAAFTQFGSDLSDDTRKRLRHGERVTEIFKQPQFSKTAGDRPIENASYVSGEQLVVILYALTNGYFDDVDVAEMRRVESELLAYANEFNAGLMQEIREKKAINDELAARLAAMIVEFFKRP
ncbi:MAG: F0F1 ATP synthase subunit alpha [Defluviitaleaceae bacterium]|nr:F0F1 ATP synthase subunit alpha [Defluviitaleaceae bacterium]